MKEASKLAGEMVIPLSVLALGSRSIIIILFFIFLKFFLFLKMFFFFFLICLTGLIKRSKINILLKLFRGEYSSNFWPY